MLSQTKAFHRSSVDMEELSSISSLAITSGRASPDEKCLGGYDSQTDEGYSDGYQSPAELSFIKYEDDKHPVDSWQCLNLHVLWQDTFHHLFDKFVHNWSLLGTFDDPNEFCPYGPRMVVHEDVAKVRFFCPDCLRAWTSMRGKVMFWFSLDYPTGQGTVVFKLFGQKCKDCDSGYFEPAMWYPEEVQKVIGNIFEKVRCQFYVNNMGGGPPQISQRRRHGKPRGYHNRLLCHACHTGHCKNR